MRRTLLHLRSSRFLLMVGAINVLLNLLMNRMFGRSQMNISVHSGLSEQLLFQSKTHYRTGETELAAFNPYHFSQPAVRLEDFPDWIQRYFQWHNAMRAQYPGVALFEDPNAPKLLIRFCTSNCGGLHDRLGKLPWDIYLANQTGRVLLINWCHPVQLENFLEPNLIDWSIPEQVKGFRSEDKIICKRTFRPQADLFQGFKSYRPSNIFFEEQVDIALERATTGQFQHQKVLITNIIGGDAFLKQRLLALNETDTIDWTPTFGKLFWAFFRPTPPVKAKLNSVYQALALVPHQYSAVHCRVSHPKSVPKGTILTPKQKNTPADTSGIAWQGETREFAIHTATKALTCTRSFTKDDSQEPIYFYSDSEELVHYIVNSLRDSHFLAKNRSLLLSNPVDYKAWSIVNQTRHLVARDVVASDTLHIDRQGGHSADAYYDSFVDLFIASRARCIALGVGNYALFSAKISGTDCAWRYDAEKWGQETLAQQDQLRTCSEFE